MSPEKTSANPDSYQEATVLNKKEREGGRSGQARRPAKAKALTPHQHHHSELREKVKDERKKDSSSSFLFLLFIFSYPKNKTS